eukprot:16445509-Heterocapsa_arctica.AAC.1
MLIARTSGFESASVKLVKLIVKKIKKSPPTNPPTPRACENTCDNNHNHNHKCMTQSSIRDNAIPSLLSRIHSYQSPNLGSNTINGWARSGGGKPYRRLQ